MPNFSDTKPVMSYGSVSSALLTSSSLMMCACDISVIVASDLQLNIVQARTAKCAHKGKLWRKKSALCQPWRFEKDTSENTQRFRIENNFWWMSFRAWETFPRTSQSSFSGCGSRPAWVPTNSLEVSSFNSQLEPVEVQPVTWQDKWESEKF